MSVKATGTGKQAKRGKKKSARPPGRPPVELDPKRAEDFGSFCATQEEMAGRLGVSVDTIRRRMQDEESEFCQAYKRGLATLKEELRRAQIKLAKRGNATMLIWLGKQLLEQRDKLEHSGPDGGPIPIDQRHEFGTAEEAREFLRQAGVRG